MDVKFFIIIFKLKNGNFKTRDFSPLIERVLADVKRRKGDSRELLKVLLVPVIISKGSNSSIVYKAEPQIKQTKNCASAVSFC